MAHLRKRRELDAPVEKPQRAPVAKPGGSVDLQRLSSDSRLYLWGLQRAVGNRAAEAMVARERESAVPRDVLGELDRLARAAHGEPGGPDFATAARDFREVFRARLAALDLGDPLPHDLQVVVAALALWSSDPGNQWGDGVWDARDLILGAADYVLAPAGQRECDAYLAEVLHRATAQVLRVHESEDQQGRIFPSGAGEWGDPARTIPHFPVVASPRLGDVVVVGDQVGIYLGSYAGRALYISAGGDVLGRAGGSATGVIQVGYGPTGSNVIYRRYQS